MIEAEWENGAGRCLGLMLAGDAIGEEDDRGEPILDDTFLLLLNADGNAVAFVLPGHEAGPGWQPVLDTRAWTLGAAGRTLRAGDAYPLEERSLALLRLRRTP
jgi:glycogen operon protein